MKMKTRFCPAPTGHLHLGNARTALFSFLLGKSNQGTFLLRIEDTDIERSLREYAAVVLDDLRWLGLEWDEGPEKGGEAGPYFQSERKHWYEQYYRVLQERGLAYPCFCSDQQLAITRKVQLAAGKPPRYAGTCLSLSPAEVEERKNRGEPYALRFHVPEHQQVRFLDIVKGEQQFISDDLGDFIIRRTNGMPSFMFCNAIDDALMHVTTVIRGEDHLTNTPRQILILQALGFRMPDYAHLPLIVGMDGAPLSKRHGSCSVLDFRNEGILSIALVNYLARLGHHYDPEYQNRLLSLTELVSLFRPERLSKAPAKFDRSQLLFWQRLAVSELTERSFWEWAGDAVQSMVPEALRSRFVSAVKPNVILPQEVLHLASVLFSSITYAGWDEAKRSCVGSAGMRYFEIIEKHIGISGVADYQTVIAQLKQEHLSGKALFMPLRLALTGEWHGPELAAVFELLGKDKILERIYQIKNLLKSIS